jgi:hypothetical protein
MSGNEQDALANVVANPRRRAIGRCLELASDEEEAGRRDRKGRGVDRKRPARSMIVTRKPAIAGPMMNDAEKAVSGSIATGELRTADGVGHRCQVAGPEERPEEIAKGAATTRMTARVGPWRRSLRRDHRGKDP